MDAVVPPAIGFECPHCGRPVRTDGDGRACTECNWLARREGGVWVLPGAVTAPADGTPALDPTEDDGRCLSALDQAKGINVISLVSPFTNGGWIPFLPLPERARVLLLEGGLGGAAMALAPEVAELWVLNPWLDRARLIARRAERAGDVHVSICSGVALPKLPFGARMFDGVVVHDLHVLRGTAIPRGDEALHSFALDLKRVLTTAGFVMLDGRIRGTFGPSNGRSVHRRALRRALDSARLTLRCDLTIRLDSLGRPYQFQNMHGALPIQSRVKNWVSAQIRTSAAGFVATPTSGPPTQSLLEGVLRQLPLSKGDLARSRETLNVGSWDVYRAETAELIVRIAASPVGVEHCRRNALAVAEMAPIPLAFAIPRVTSEGTWRGMTFVAETRLPGRTVSGPYASPRKREQLFRDGQMMLANLYDQTRRTVRLDEGAVMDLFANPLERITAFLEPEVTRPIGQARDWVCRRFSGTEWTLARTHGDYKVTNLLADRRGRVTGIVDWDFSRPAGLPLTDTILMKAFDRSILGGIHIGRAIFDAGFGSLRWREQLPEALRCYVLCEDQWRATALAALLDYFFHTLHPYTRWSPLVRSVFSETVGDACRRLTA